MAGLAETVRREVEKYAVRSPNSTNYPLLDDKLQIYTVLSILNESKPDRVLPLITARVINDKVVVDADATNKPLVDALLQAGIPREKIVLAYEGETFPSESVSQQTVS